MWVGHKFYRSGSGYWTWANSVEIATKSNCICQFTTTLLGRLRASKNTLYL